MNLHQYAVYRKKERFSLIEEKGQMDSNQMDVEVHMEDFREIYSHACEEQDTAFAIRKYLEAELPNDLGMLQTGDVIVVNHDGIVISYYVEQDRLRIVPEFIRLQPEDASVHPDTKDFKIAGMGEETWSVCDSIIIDGEQFYLMENSRFREAAAMPVLDAYGKLVLRQTFDGFSPDVIGQIRKNRESAGFHMEVLPVESDNPELGKKALLSRYADYHHMIGRTMQKKKADPFPGHSAQTQGAGVAEDMCGHNGSGPRMSVLLRLRQKQNEIAGKHHSASISGHPS